MSVTLDPTKVCASIAALLRADYEHSDGEHRFTTHGEAGTVFTVTATAFDDIASRLGGNSQALTDTSLGSPRFFEVLAAEESRFGISTLFRDIEVLQKDDPENDLRYRLGPPSDEFLLFFLGRLADVAPPAAIRSTATIFRVRRAMERSDSPSDVISLVRAAYPRLLSCRVESGHNRAPADLASHANAYLFQLTYNLNVAIVETRSLDDFTRSGRLASMRRSRPADIEPPKRTYLRDLTYHYQLGVSADSPVLAFLSFYHVAEHFFEAVFHDDLLDAIRDRITRPDFSTKRKKDVQALVKDINKRQRIRDDTITINEQEALRLALVKYAPLDSLRAKLTAYDKTLIPYISSTKVAFCDGDAVDLDHEDPKYIYKALAQRIYRTRNSIVHSKDGDKSRFVPFEHDDDLAKEVPLMRFVAEEIIVATSELV
jgi:hypothetical protein